MGKTVKLMRTQDDDAFHPRDHPLRDTQRIRKPIQI